MQELIQQLNDKELEYREEKWKLEVTKANYWLKTDFSMVLNKAKPTQKEKEAYIKEETRVQESKVEVLKTEYHTLERTYEALLRDKL